MTTSGGEERSPAPGSSTGRAVSRSLVLLVLTLALAACSGSVAGTTSGESSVPAAGASVTSTAVTSTTTAGTTTSATAGATVPPTTSSAVPIPSAASSTRSSPAADPTQLPVVGLSGVNDPACRSALPPVVLLHGTFATPAGDFRRLAPALRTAGRCVYAVLYGAAFGYGGIGSIRDSARTVGAFLEQVSTTTGSTAVDVVAFSQGALVLRAALQDSVPAGTVRLAVLLAPDYHGTSVPIVTKVPAALCPSCAEQVRGSALLRALDAGGELAPGVRYASLLLDDDAWVQPLAEQSPRGPSDRVRVQILQQACPDVQVQHSVLPSDPAAVAWTLAALAGEGRPARSFSCR